MKRRIIEIDAQKCDGCGLCAQACHEGAIGMVDGKAKLLREDYCDGLGDCLPACPTGAISFVEREAAAYDAQAVAAAKGPLPAAKEPLPAAKEPLPCGCPGTQARALPRAEGCEPGPGSVPEAGSELRQWPVQIKLVPAGAPYLNGADLLVAADCTAYAYGAFHRRFMRGRVTLIGCPKLDEGDYADKLNEILTRNDIRQVALTRMEVPCCGGLERAARTAIERSGKHIPLTVFTLSTDGRIIDEKRED